MQHKENKAIVNGHTCVFTQQEQMYEGIKILLVTGITRNVSIIDEVTIFSSFGLLREKI